MRDVGEDSSDFVERVLNEPGEPGGEGFHEAVRYLFRLTRFS
jgi:hypothetical protein